MYAIRSYYALGFAQFIEGGGIFLQLVGGVGIDYPDPVQAPSLAREICGNILCASQQGDLGDLLAIQNVRRFQHPFVASFGQHDAAPLNLCRINDLLNKRTTFHWLVSPFWLLQPAPFLQKSTQS